MSSQQPNGRRCRQRPTGLKDELALPCCRQRPTGAKWALPPNECSGLDCEKIRIGEIKADQFAQQVCHDLEILPIATDDFVA